MWLALAIILSISAHSKDLGVANQSKCEVACRYIEDKFDGGDYVVIAGQPKCRCFRYYKFDQAIKNKIPRADYSMKSSIDLDEFKPNDEHSFVYKDDEWSF